MNFSSEVKTDRKTVFEMDPIFIYKVPDQLGRRHKASDWNVLSPHWYGKLRIFEAGSYCCEVQFENNNGVFGVANIKDSDFLSSRAFQKVLDSSRYFTLKIKNTSATEDELFGIGFLSRSDATSLRGALHDYFMSQNQTPGVGSKVTETNDTIKPTVKVARPGLLPTPDTLSKQPLFDGDNRNLRKRCITELPRDTSVGHNNSDDINGSTQPKFGKIQQETEQQQHHNLLQNPLFSPQNSGRNSHMSVPVLVPGDENNGTSYQDAGTKLLVCHLCIPPSPDFPPTNKISLLLKHWEMVHGLSKPHVCRHCFLIFNNAELLKKHKIDAQHFNCHFCPCEFVNENNFSRHLYRVHKHLHA